MVYIVYLVSIRHHESRWYPRGNRLDPCDDGASSHAVLGWWRFSEPVPTERTFTAEYLAGLFPRPLPARFIEHSDLLKR